MTTKYTTSSAGWMIADPEGNIIAAAADKDTAIARAGISDIRAGNPGIRPEGAYTIYLCNQDIVDYFRLRSPRPILWVDIDFTPVGIAHMRLKRSSADSKVSRTISIHAHAYYRLQSLSPNHGMASFLDEVVDSYLESHLHLLRPVSSSEGDAVCSSERV